MPGYSIDWGSISKPIAETKEIQFIHSLESSRVLISNKSVTRDIDMKLVEQYQFNISRNRKTNLKAITEHNLSTIPDSSEVIHNAVPADTVKHQHKDLPEHHLATRSLTYGVLAIAIPLALLFIAIAINAGTTIGLGLILIIPIILILSFSIVGMIAGIKAIRAIKKEPDKYSGMGNAIVGIVLSSLLPLAILLLIIIDAVANS